MEWYQYEIMKVLNYKKHVMRIIFINIVINNSIALQ